MSTPVPKISYSVKEAAQATSLSRSTIFNLIKSGELESTKVRGRRVILAEALQHLLAEGEADAA